MASRLLGAASESLPGESANCRRCDWSVGGKNSTRGTTAIPDEMTKSGLRNSI